MKAYRKEEAVEGAFQVKEDDKKARNQEIEKTTRRRKAIIMEATRANILHVSL